MGVNRIVIVISAIAALLAGATLVRLISIEHLLRSATCNRELDECNRGCDQTFNEALARINLQRDEELIEHRQRLIDCNLNTSSATQCRQEEVTRHDQVVAQLDARERAAGDTRTTCKQACSDAAEACERGEPQAAPHVGGGSGAVQIDCIDQPGFPCYQKVDKICQQLGGACDNCKLTLCGDGSWNFTATGLQETALVAMSGGKETRTLSSSKSGSLTIPRDIKLGDGEELQVRFQFAPDAKGRRITVERK